MHSLPLRLRLTLLAAAAVATFCALPIAGANAASTDPLLAGTMPHPVKLISVTGSRAYTWSSPDPDGSTSTGFETFSPAGLKKPLRMKSAFNTFHFRGTVTGNAVSTYIATDCGGWSYDAASIDFQAGLLFTRKSRSKVFVTLTHGQDPAKLETFMGSYGNSVCGGIVLGTGSITQFVNELGVNDACDGSDMCTTVSRKTILKKRFTLHFARTYSGKLNDTTKSFVTSYTLTFKRA